MQHLSFFFVGRRQNIMVFRDRIEYLRAGTVMTRALQLFLICCAALLLKQSPVTKVVIKSHHLSENGHSYA